MVAFFEDEIHLLYGWRLVRYSAHFHEDLGRAGPRSDATARFLSFDTYPQQVGAQLLVERLLDLLGAYRRSLARDGASFNERVAFVLLEDDLKQIGAAFTREKDYLSGTSLATVGGRSHLGAGERAAFELVGSRQSVRVLGVGEVASTGGAHEDRLSGHKV
jgi:hypothetical protein